jgi:SPP1 gp7 family putative phage head morphogenesis protein
MSRRTVRLTKARAERAHAGHVYKGDKLANPAAVESRYVVGLTSLCAQMTSQVQREVLRLFNEPWARAHFALDGTFPLAAEDAAPGPNIASQARILVRSLEGRFNALFAKRAPFLAEQMVEGAGAASKSALHSSLAKMTGGLSLKTSLMTPGLRTVYKASVTENVSLIKTIAAEYLKNVERSVMRSITSGNGLQTLVPELQKYEGYTHRKAKNVALDQTRKTYNTINRERMTGIGVTHYQWIHSGGGAEPRPLHMEYDGQIFAFAEPPVIDERTGERGIPGQAINCRCTMRPVFKFDAPE